MGSNEPQDVVSRAAAAGMRAIEDSLAAEGAEALEVVVMLRAKGVPENELDACSCSAGLPTAQDLFFWQLRHLKGLGSEVGLRVAVIGATS